MFYMIVINNREARFRFRMFQPETPPTTECFPAGTCFEFSKRYNFQQLKVGLFKFEKFQDNNWMLV